jgi:Lon-like ATP-dependent protease
VFAATGKDEKEEGLTAVLYPHRRIRITELVKSGASPEAATASVEPVTGEIVEAPKSALENAVADGTRSVGTLF